MVVVCLYFYVMLIQLFVTMVPAGPAVGFLDLAYNATEGSGVLNVIVERLSEDMTPFSVMFELRDGTAVCKCIV